MLLGSIYARQGKWGGSDSPASAIYQYERAADAERLNGRSWGHGPFRRFGLDPHSKQGRQSIPIGVFLTKTAKSQFVSKNSDQPGAAATRPLVADAELFRPAANAAGCSRCLQSRQRTFADDIALELGLLQFPAKR